MSHHIWDPEGPDRMLAVTLLATTKGEGRVGAVMAAGRDKKGVG